MEARADSRALILFMCSLDPGGSHSPKLLAAACLQAKSVYQARSPLNHTERLNRAVIFYHGDEDKVVPPNQAQTMYDALKSKGAPTAYILYKGKHSDYAMVVDIDHEPMGGA